MKEKMREILFTPKFEYFSIFPGKKSVYLTDYIGCQVTFDQNLRQLYFHRALINENTFLPRIITKHEANLTRTRFQGFLRISTTKIPLKTKILNWLKIYAPYNFSELLESIYMFNLPI